MSKEIMLSIQPKHLANILNGTKTLELRKSVPKDYKGWVNLYCTKGIKDILYKYKDKYYTQHYLTFTDSVEVLNSKVVARFWFDECDMYYFNGYQNEYRLISQDKNRFVSAIMGYDELCLTENQVNEYGKGKQLYAWHIKKLEIFDIPLRLSDFYKATLYASGQVIKEYEKQTNDFSYRLKKAPQSYQFVYRKGE